jgi:hypothetical protein
MNVFIFSLYTPPVITRNYSAIAIFTLFNSRLHTHTLVISWQRNYNTGTRNHILRFETSLFVASYDSQGGGGGVRPRLHTGVTDGQSIPSQFQLPYSLISSRHGPRRETQSLYCCMAQTTQKTPVTCQTASLFVR